LLPDSILLCAGRKFEPMIEGVFPASLRVIIVQHRLEIRRSLMDKKKQTLWREEPCFYSIRRIAEKAASGTKAKERLPVAVAESLFLNGEWLEVCDYFFNRVYLTLKRF
jgi:hypothetical protein